MMIHGLYTKVKKMVVSLRLSILSIFILLFVLAILLLVSISYFNFSKSMSEVARHYMNQTSTFIFNNVATELQHVKTETEMAAELISNHTINVENNSETLDFLLYSIKRQMNTFSSIQSLFWSGEDGKVILAGVEKNNNMITHLVVRNKNIATRVITTRDLSNHIKKTETEVTNYDPRVRSWYIDAKKSLQTTITDPYHYIFFSQPFWGITIGSPVVLKNGQFIGVFGINLRLDFLRNLIEKIKISKNSIIFIVSDNGDLVAFPHLVQYLNPSLKNIASINNPAVAMSFNIYQKLHQPEFRFQSGHQNYLVSYKEFAGFTPHSWLLGIVIPEDDFITELKKTNVLTIVIGIFILLFGIALFSILISRAVGSFKKLMSETDEIKNFHLDNDIRIESHIKEVVYLAESLNNMKKGLRSFQKYVPADLVRQLIETGNDAQIGGTKKQLVTFFSDIKNFTSISETLSPTQLMTYTCEYFDELSKIITKEHGTIDKYIGDAIMAFWGAPFEEPDPCYRAAKAAIECQNRLAELNKVWQARSIPPFITRIGIHIGEAIVGNLGSSNRLNYTALGDAINTASRLEGANKIYQTKIIVSEAVYLLIKDRFYLRLLDYVALKGKEQATYIYELIAEKNAVLPFDIEAYQKLFHLGFSEYQKQHWDNAIHYFEQCLFIYTNDEVAKLFIHRCQQFKLNPPGLDWSGVWYF